MKIYFFVTKRTVLSKKGKCYRKYNVIFVALPGMLRDNLDNFKIITLKTKF